MKSRAKIIAAILMVSGLAGLGLAGWEDGQITKAGVSGAMNMVEYNKELGYWQNVQILSDALLFMGGGIWLYHYYSKRRRKATPNSG